MIVHSAQNLEMALDKNGRNRIAYVNKNGASCRLGKECAVSLSAAGHWRPATRADLAGIVAIAAEVHPDLPERSTVLDEKRLLFSQGCFCFDNDGAVLGYALAHPWTLYGIPPLDRFLGAIPPDADCLYLHDVALLDAARGKGAARALIHRLDGVAGQARLPALALTSVKGTRPLWEALGFAPVSDKRLNVDSYGGSAVYMIKRLLLLQGESPSSAGRSQQQE